MKNFIQPGVTVTVPAPADVESGDGVEVGSLFGIAVHDADNGDDVEITTEGVFDLAKADEQAWTVGAPVYWDSSGGVATSADGGGANAQIGVAMEAISDAVGNTIGRVRLNGSF